MSDAYRFIAAEKANYPISLMSRLLGVSRQGFHACRVLDIADEAGVAYGLVYH